MAQDLERPGRRLRRDVLSEVAPDRLYHRNVMGYLFLLGGKLFLVEGRLELIKRLCVNFWGNDTWREVGLSYPRCVIIQIRKRLPIPLIRRFALRLLGDPFL